jgi:hypothetical protein
MIQRQIPDAGELSRDELRTISQQSNGVLSEMTQDGDNVQWVQSMVLDDALVCIYVASSPDLLREHARRGGFPIDKVSEVHALIDPTTAE